jgi:hypothetical protein
MRCFYTRDGGIQAVGFLTALKDPGSKVTV